MVRTVREVCQSLLKRLGFAYGLGNARGVFARPVFANQQHCALMQDTVDARWTGGLVPRRGGADVSEFVHARRCMPERGTGMSNGDDLGGYG